MEGHSLGLGCKVKVSFSIRESCPWDMSVRRMESTEPILTHGPLAGRDPEAGREWRICLAWWPPGDKKYMCPPALHMAEAPCHTTQWPSTALCIPACQQPNELPQPSEWSEWSRRHQSVCSHISRLQGIEKSLFGKCEEANKSSTLLWFKESRAPEFVRLCKASLEGEGLSKSWCDTRLWNNPKTEETSLCTI